MTVFLITSGIAIIVIYHFRNDIVRGAVGIEVRTAPIRSKLLPVPAHYREILSKYFNYYQRLSTNDKRKFEHRVVYFIRSKRFIPRNFSKPTEEMKVTIAAVAVQLTFGFPTIYLQHFRTILIYPDDYYSSITKQYHRGEVNPAFGIIVLSWKSFVHGFIDYTNAINVGLHEIAHALRLENMIRDEEFGFLDAEALEVLNDWAYRICHDPQEQVMFFRPYACTNEHEFFAVAVENFFEKASDFKAALPELYTAMTVLLKQDTLKLLS
jgi:MtfA peptidase